MMRILFAWVLFNFLYFSAPCALAAGPLGESPNFARVQINPDDSVGEIQSITQDHNGFLWFAGRNGLARFDGYRFHVYRSDPQNPPVLEINSLASVFEDSFGELWVGAYGGGVARLNRLDDSFHIYKYEINSKGKTGAQVFKDFIEDDQHNLWAVGPDGIALYDRTKNVFKRYFEDSPQIKDPLYGLVQLQGDDYFLVGSNEVFLWNKAVNTLETIKPVTSNGLPLILASPRASLKDSKGNIWIGHENGLYKFHLQSKTFELVPLKNVISPGHNAAIWRIFEDEKGILWLSTDGNGLMYFDPNTLDSGAYTRTVAPSSLGAATIRSTFKDKAGDLWISTFPVGL